MKIVRTEKEIEKEIKRLSEDRNNFTTDNYGSEAADNGIYEINFSEFLTERTLKEFVEWLTTKYKKHYE